MRVLRLFVKERVTCIPSFNMEVSDYATTSHYATTCYYAITCSGKNFNFTVARVAVENR